jgi:hypothetical protein
MTVTSSRHKRRRDARYDVVKMTKKARAARREALIFANQFTDLMYEIGRELSQPCLEHLRWIKETPADYKGVNISQDASPVRLKWSRRHAEFQMKHWGIERSFMEAILLVWLTEPDPVLACSLEGIIVRDVRADLATLSDRALGKIPVAAREVWQT